jgi:hypothetical protein
MLSLRKIYALREFSSVHASFHDLFNEERHNERGATSPDREAARR